MDAFNKAIRQPRIFTNWRIQDKEYCENLRYAKTGRAELALATNFGFQAKGLKEWMQKD